MELSSLDIGLRVKRKCEVCIYINCLYFIGYGI